MSLVFQNTTLTAGNPQTHALVIGVGEYPHLKRGKLFATQPAATTMGLGQLTSSPLSAAAFANWLVTHLSNPQAPLGSVELLLSPDSYTDPQGVTTHVHPATLQNIQATFNSWDARLEVHKKNVGIFYFCGHGLAKGAEMLLLPEDFGANPNNPWDTAINFDLTWYGMYGCQAATQCYYLDCCRETPIELLQTIGVVGRVLKALKPSFPDRDAYVLKAAPLGRKAHGPENGVSFFTQGLIRCFDALGADYLDGNKWKVTTASLAEAILRYMKRVKLPGGMPGSCSRGGESSFITEIHELPGSAQVMTTIACDPAAALAAANLAVLHNLRPALTRVPGPDPWDLEIEAGTYDVEAKFPNHEYQDKTKPMNLYPRYCPCRLEVT